jgi:GT2 family glycosyltransferase/glycosyltransferase involved in cell wall biosynthesis
MRYDDRVVRHARASLRETADWRPAGIAMWADILVFPRPALMNPLSALWRFFLRAAETLYLLFAWSSRRSEWRLLFSHVYYRETCTAARLTRLPRPLHFIFFGRGSGASPHPLFDPAFYLHAYRDVAERGHDAFAHFLRYGLREDRSPHPLFVPEFYASCFKAPLPGSALESFLGAVAAPGIQPHPLFDPHYYVSHYTDVRDSGENALVHYLIWGWKEGRDPHPLFDSAWYLSQQSASARCIPALLHYLQDAGSAASPHPLFDARYYLTKNQDVAATGRNPLLHFLTRGATESRAPNPSFNIDFYLRRYPDVGAQNPLVNYVLVGQAEGRLTEPAQVIEEFLPVVSLADQDDTIDVIIPVYRHRDYTLRCINSVLNAVESCAYRVIVVNDCTPEPQLTRTLHEYAASGRITLVENRRNRGFVYSANRGMRMHASRDVVLLNSDTVVANNWLTRLRRAACSSEEVGTATPFSNNATICSFPVPFESNIIDPNRTAELDSLFREANDGRTHEIPTAVGFCMYIRRACLRETGLFDEDAFGAGYGEENDFCMRAARVGWRHVLAADVFVYHEGEVSFSERARVAKERGLEIVARRHPEYKRAVAEYVRTDAAAPGRVAVSVLALQKSARPKILFITHMLGGGVAQHVHELSAAISAQAHVLQLQPVFSGTVRLTSLSPDIPLTADFSSRRPADIARLLEACGVSRIHVHHLLGVELDIRRLAEALEVPFDLTIHDYRLICPQTNLTDSGGAYCGEPDEHACDECLDRRPASLGMDIQSWRRSSSWLLYGADRVITPTADTAHRILRYAPGARVISTAHPGAPACNDIQSVNRRPVAPDAPLRIATLGVLAPHKGLPLVQACAEAARERNLPLEFIHIGYVESQSRGETPFAFAETGAYEASDLPRLIEAFECNLVWFPATWPETYSYTLDGAIRAEMPIVAMALGAIAERVAGRPDSWLLPSKASPEECIAFFLQLREAWNDMPAPHPRCVDASAAAVPFYESAYISGTTQTSARVTRPRGRVVIAGLLSADGVGRLDACAYIRALLPLGHSSLSDLVQLVPISGVECLNDSFDAVLVQRAAVSSERDANHVLAWSSRSGRKLIYEIDDDLLSISSDHADYAQYSEAMAAARLIIANADPAIVSTEALAASLRTLSRRVVVLPNALDERLWAAGSDAPAQRARAGVVRGLYTGTFSHGQDLELLRDAVEGLQLPFRLDIVGITSEQGGSWYDRVTVPENVATSYPRFVRWIRAQRRWGFAVAPLVESSFNAAKSHLKYLDYSGLRLPGLYSDVAPYRTAVSDGRTGLLIANDAKSWREGLAVMIQDAELGRRIAKAAAEDLARNHTLAAQRELRRQFWSELLYGSRSAVGTSRTEVHV